jgi:hypothetical protein
MRCRCHIAHHSTLRCRSMRQVLELKPCDECETMNKSITFYVNFTV